MISKIGTIQPARPGEIDLLRNIDKEARRRYLSLKGFERLADSPPIKAERFNGGEALVAHRGTVPVGFVLVQIIDESVYMSLSTLPTSLFCPKLLGRELEGCFSMQQKSEQWSSQHQL